MITLFRKRAVPFPTLAGWAFILVIAGTPLAWWFVQGESFFCLTERYPADGLVVEGWIGIQGVLAAKAEFEHGGYRYIVTSGAFSGNRWDSRRWNYATEAGELLVRFGVPADQVIVAAAPDSESHRTFGAAIAVRQALQKRELHPAALNIFTFGSHSRRSRLVFAKAMSPSTAVGTISWAPTGFHDGSWWKSSERSLDLIKETIGYLFEVLLNSGRISNRPPEITPPKS
jgi:uncharacterized SAM-binding protein YcdF (DUF218 family)